MSRFSSTLAGLVGLLAVTFLSSCSSSNSAPISVGLSASATQTDQGKSVTLTATSQLARAGKLVGLCIQARKNGDNVLTGVTGMRLVNLSVKG